VNRYTVVWLRDAIDELGEIWLASHDRNAVTAASAEIDRELASDAMAKGKPLSEGLRVYVAPPLRVVFSVSDPDRKVEVARVRLL
jgi:plasmid stabilization system protein ParE